MEATPSGSDPCGGQRGRRRGQQPRARALAPAMVPAMEAISSVLSTDFPAMNCPPPLEKVTIMEPPYLAAASIQELMELVPTMLTPGMAYPCSLAASRRSTRAAPVTTPGLTEAGSLAKALVSVAVSSAMFKALLCTPKEAAGEKAAAEPTRRVAIASFMVYVF